MDLAEPSRSGIVAADFFCGAGGLTVGLTRGHVEVRFGTDVWGPAARTYACNFPGHPFEQADARDLTRACLDQVFPADGRLRMFVGGPPCQGFSSAGIRKTGDRRNTLVGRYATLAAEVRPEIVLFENVEGFLTAEGGRFVFDLLDPLIEAGYQVTLQKLNVANYGVPQLRKRVIAIAALHRRPVGPVPTHRAFGAPGTSRIGMSLAPARSVGEALADLGPVCDTPPGTPTHHVRTRTNSDDQKRIALLEQGQTMRDLPEQFWHDSYRRRANRRVADGTPSARRGGAPAGLRRLRQEEPSKAITAAASREFIHPTQHRFLSLRECARIQTFCDDFQFLGARSEVATMIGNAVPPAFAEALAVAVTETLASPPDVGLTTGRLHQFAVTAADVCSPALSAVIAAVNHRYSIGNVGR